MVNKRVKMDWKNLMPGAEKKVISNNKELKAGMNVEKEHGPKEGEQFNVTKNRKELTRKIAMVHLKEVPDYYTRLKRLEREGKSAPSNKVLKRRAVLKNVVRRNVK